MLGVGDLSGANDEIRSLFTIIITQIDLLAVQINVLNSL